MGGGDGRWLESGERCFGFFLLCEVAEEGPPLSLSSSSSEWLSRVATSRHSSGDRERRFGVPIDANAKDGIGDAFVTPKGFFPNERCDSTHPERRLHTRFSGSCHAMLLSFSDRFSFSVAAYAQLNEIIMPKTPLRILQLRKMREETVVFRVFLPLAGVIS